MKILAFTDSHGSIKSIRKIKKTAKNENIDLIVCAGDLTIFENGMDSLVRKLSRIKKQILIIHGNHESEHDLKKICSRFKNIKFIHKKAFLKNNHVFIGYGGGGFAMLDHHFSRAMKPFKKYLAETKKPKSKKGKKKYEIVLITHGPPFGNRTDLIMDEHCGNKTITDFIRKYNIELVITGHLHENFNVEDKIGKTRIINPGPFGKIIKI